MKNFKTIAILVFFIFGMTFSALAQVNNEKGGTGDASKAKTRGDDPNIKVEQRMNSADQESKAIQSPDKGAPSHRGGLCYVIFDNWTDWYLDCYVDGYYEGMVAPWGEGYVTVGAGNTTLYSVARFDDGSRISWGPVEKYCNYEDFTMRVYEDSYYWSVE